MLMQSEHTSAPRLLPCIRAPCSLAGQEWISDTQRLYACPALQVVTTAVVVVVTAYACLGHLFRLFVPVF